MYHSTYLLKAIIGLSITHTSLDFTEIVDQNEHVYPDSSEPNAFRKVIEKG